MPEASTQRALIDNLCKALRKHDGTQFVNVLETHISYVLLTGPYAYKIKKAVKFDFLDFSTLALRHFYCLEELRLNRRCAPQLYLDLVAINGSPEAPIIEGSGPVIEYAVKMIEFPQENLADRLLDRGELRREHIDALTMKLAVLHRSCGRAAPGSLHGASKSILQQARDALIGIRRLLGEPADLVDLDNLEKWTEQEFIARSNTFAKRKIDGFVRECHGDLHLGNVALVNGEMLFFDCIEFSEDLRWIDVMSEVAFLFMDLQAHERSDFGYRFINAYLEETGDYAGLSVLRFYVVYRAIVRAEITLLRMPQCNGEDRAELAKIARSYLDLAKRWTQPMQPTSAALILTHGLSGSGKTTVSQDILQAVGAIRLRSDVERKRLAGMPATISSQSEIGEGLYASDATEATYRRLFTLAQSILNAGYTVIVDATFLQSKQRGMFSMWADKHRIPFSMVSVTAPQSVLRERITQREQEGNDPSEASLSVLDHQLRVQQPFSPDELPSVIFCDFSRSINEAGSLGAWRADLIDEINNKICNKGGQTAVLSGIITT